MEAEIISVGTEITLGQITNTNAQFLADQLRQLNIENYWQTIVDDNPERIIAAIHNADKRADLIFICGGLGPTDDDRTMDSTAKALNVKLKLDQEYWKKLKIDFAHRHISPEIDNKRQAFYLDGGAKLENPVGLALGSYIKKDGHQYVVLPGPPREFKAMVLDSLLPLISSSNNEIVSRTMHFVGYPESLLMKKILPFIDDHRVIATSYVQPDEVQVRLTIHNVENNHANTILDAVEKRIKEQVGEYYFGTGRNIKLVNQVVALLKKKDLHITAAESLTGGLFQSTICSVPGASNVFDGGFITYSAKMKEKLIGVPSDVINRYGVVSAQTARFMAECSKEKIGADIGVGFTGVAGPDPLEGHPVGDVWIGISINGLPTRTVNLHLSSQFGRQEIRVQSIQLALLNIYKMLK